jgi:RNA-directed DNA polymerase
MRESDAEGLATHGGPESCAGAREDAGEALAGGVQARLLSREINSIEGAHTVTNVEGNIADGARREPPADPARSKNQGMYASSMRENREGPPFVRHLIKGGPPGEGQGRKPGMGGQSDSPVVPAKPANKPARGKTAHTHAGAESVEERGLAKGNTESAARSGHSAGSRAPRALDRVRQAARRGRGGGAATSWMWCDRQDNPEDRLDARHPRQEPSAVVPLAGICAGGRP